MSEALYLIIVAPNIKSLQEKVIKSVRNGFIPTGGITFRAYSPEYYQAMFKPESKPL